MSRRRYVSTVISQDTRVNKLAVQYGDFAALLYTWMIPHAADDATLPGDPEELLYQILPGRRDKSADDVLAALDGMAALDLIAYTEDGRVAFPTKAFYKYQTYIKDRNKHRDDDPPDDAAKSAQPAAPSQPAPTHSAKQRKTAQNAVSFKLTSSPSFSPSPLDSPPPVGDDGADAPPPPNVRPIRAAPKREDRETRIPDVFPITEKMREWAREKVPRLDLDWAHEEFCTYWRSVKTKRLDWEQTWQNGMIKAYGRLKESSHAVTARGTGTTGRASGYGNRRRPLGAPGSLGPGGYDSWADKD